MRARIEPGRAATHDFDIQCAIVEIEPVEIGNLKLTARRGLQIPCPVHNRAVVKIKAGHGIIRFRLRRLFLDRNCPTGCIERHNPIFARVRHAVAKYRRTIGTGIGCCEFLRQSVAIKNIIAQNQR